MVRIITIIFVFITLVLVFVYIPPKTSIKEKGLGAIPSKTECTISNCHGPITCGPNSAKDCSGEYQQGDVCRYHSYCSMINSECIVKTNEYHNQCLKCVDQCKIDNKDDVIKQIACEQYKCK